MLVTHYLAGLPDATSPALLLTRPEIGMERSLYDVYADNLEEIIQRMSKPVDESNIQEFLLQQPDVASNTSAGAPAPQSLIPVVHREAPKKHEALLDPMRFL